MFEGWKRIGWGIIALIAVGIFILINFMCLAN
jgi:hypothetical protein